MLSVCLSSAETLFLFCVPVDVLKSHHDRNVPLPAVVLCKVCMCFLIHTELCRLRVSPHVQIKTVILENVSQTCTTVSSYKGTDKQVIKLSVRHPRSLASRGPPDLISGYK